ncbi:ABC transporter substrate-binding protein [Helicobacter sp. MIT 05-5293]|uniref:MetQ/NlpA family ABC transporter substrate-binding protein n=1 Tax=Helicobacter sp. MIT 05-5293 TaxID=1548149 RepID=UPI0010FE0CEB|nr:MetQ/NlpA family ABC transporter substrate-binding protein [Helicobacter sp. MIT 05-5293]TLD80988.1 ABC transporter substrate-binding protein [Helicobacter sp. MIT 05-5293]
MTKIWRVLLGVLVISSFWACSSNEQNKNDSKEVSEQAADAPKVLKVGATPVPASEILEFVKPILASQGIDMQIQTFTDYVVPNVSLAEGSSDANMYQHKPFMDNTNAQKGYHLVSIAPIYIVPLGLYSKKYDDLASLPDGSTIAIPGDASNMARAFILLHDNGLIKLANPSDLGSSELDIVENPKKFIFKPMEAASLPLILDSVDAAVINANYALQAKMSIKEAFFHENDKSAYINVLVAREDNKDNELILALRDALLSPETRDFILEKYQGEIIPVSAQ